MSTAAAQTDTRSLPPATTSASARSRSPRPRPQEIAKQRDKRGTPDAMIRVGVRGGGCTGFTYVFEWADAAPPTDKVFSAHGVSIVVDPKSLVYLGGMTARLRARDDGSRVQVQQPERQGLVRLWRERQVLDAFATARALPAQFDLDPQVIERAFFDASKELHPDRFASAPAARAGRRAVAVARAQRRVPDAQEAGRARRVSARARRRDDRRQRAARSGVPDGDPRAARGARRGARREASSHEVDAPAARDGKRARKRVGRRSCAPLFARERPRRRSRSS